MGVPGFFAWLLKHDRNNQILKKKLINRPHTLFFDANCLFHPQCFKILKAFPFETSVNKLEEIMMERIINYIDYLIDYVGPSELVFIAVDGVAPLAKINQQRKRRYKSVEENLMKNNIYKKYNIPNNTNWSNIVITPGTDFMRKLDKKIKEYIHMKMIKLNKKVNIQYSSYEERGEGEHKILQYLKSNYIKTEKTHIIYGLDADLIFLALASGFSSIYLLREQSNFGRPKHQENESKPNPNPIKDVIEELTYVSIENSRNTFNTYFKSRLDIEPDNELDFINDFVFLCYFLGNDFLPHIPSISIRKDGIEILMDAYLYAYERTEQQLIINNSYSKLTFKFFLEYLADIEKTFFKENKNNKNYQRPYCPSSHLKPYEKELWEMENLVGIYKNPDLDKDPLKLYSEFVEMETSKSNYYQHYFHMRFNIKNQIKRVTKSYFELLKWVGLYYFDRVPCWNLQYDFDASPFVSDLYENFEQFFEIQINVNNESLTMEQQLLSVIPPANNDFLDKRISKKMKDINILHMLPIKVVYDYEYKDKFWLCDAIMPYLDYNEIRIV